MQRFKGTTALQHGSSLVEVMVGVVIALLTVMVIYRTFTPSKPCAATPRQLATRSRQHF